jgi:tetratricopeptide (TPR) repeat protein
LKDDMMNRTLLILVFLATPALTAEPDADALFEEALTAYTENDFARAEALFDKGFAQYQSADFAYWLGLSRYAQQKWALAADALERFLQKNPNDPDGLCKLAACRERLGRTAQAGQLFEKVLAADPTHSEARTGLMRIRTATPPPPAPNRRASEETAQAAPADQPAEPSQPIPATRSAEPAQSAQTAEPAETPEVVQKPEPVQPPAPEQIAEPSATAKPAASPAPTEPAASASHHEPSGSVPASRSVVQVTPVMPDAPTEPAPARTIQKKAVTDYPDLSPRRSGWPDRLPGKLQPLTPRTKSGSSKPAPSQTPTKQSSSSNTPAPLPEIARRPKADSTTQQPSRLSREDEEFREVVRRIQAESAFAQARRRQRSSTSLATTQRASPSKILAWSTYNQNTGRREYHYVTRPESEAGESRQPAATSQPTSVPSSQPAEGETSGWNLASQNGLDVQWGADSVWWTHLLFGVGFVVVGVVVAGIWTATGSGPGAFVLGLISQGMLYRICWGPQEGWWYVLMIAWVLIMSGLPSSVADI